MLFIYQTPKKNHDAMERIGKPFVKWFKNHGVRTEIYPHLYTATSEQMEKAREGVESITKTLSIKDDEEIWVMLQFYRDRDHAEVAAKMMTMQDESMGQLMNEFDGLVTHGSSLIMGGFSQLKV